MGRATRRNRASVDVPMPQLVPIACFGVFGLVVGSFLLSFIRHADVEQAVVHMLANPLPPQEKAAGETA